MDNDEQEFRYTTIFKIGEGPGEVDYKEKYEQEQYNRQLNWSTALVIIVFSIIPGLIEGCSRGII